MYTTTLFLSNDTCRGGQVPETNLTIANIKNSSCKPLKYEHYLEMVYISFSEFPSKKLIFFFVIFFFLIQPYF